MKLFTTKKPTTTTNVPDHIRLMGVPVEHGPAPAPRDPTEIVYTAICSNRDLHNTVVSIQASCLQHEIDPLDHIRTLVYSAIVGNPPPNTPQTALLCVALAQIDYPHLNSQLLDSFWRLEHEGTTAYEPPQR